MASPPAVGTIQMRSSFLSVFEEAVCDGVGDPLAVGAELGVVNFADLEIVVNGDGARSGTGCLSEKRTGEYQNQRKNESCEKTELHSNDPLRGLWSAKNKRRSVTQALLIDGGERESGSSGKGLRTGRLRSTKVRLARQKKYSLEMHFLVACRSESCILRMRTRFTAARERGSLRRTRVKIEFFIASCPDSFPCNFNSEKKSRQAHAVAACGCHVFHGVWRHVWDGRDCSRGGLRARDFDFAVPAGAVVLADGVHDRGTFERAACRGRLLRLGAAGLGKFLGISGSVAVAGGQHL